MGGKILGDEILSKGWDEILSKEVRFYQRDEIKGGEILSKGWDEILSKEVRFYQRDGMRFYQRGRNSIKGGPLNKALAMNIISLAQDPTAIQLPSFHNQQRRME